MAKKSAVKGDAKKPAMGRPRLDPDKSILLHQRLDAKTDAMLEQLKERWNTSRSEVVRRCVREIYEREFPPSK